MLRIYFIILSITLGMGQLYAKAFLPESFTVNFKQEYQSEVSKRSRVTYGLIEYQFPSKIRFEITKPEGKESLFVANKNKSWFYTPPFIEGEKGQVSVNNQRADLLSRFFDGLNKGLSDNELYSVEKKEQYVELVFKDSSKKEINVKKARFYFKDASRDSFSKVTEMQIVAGDERVLHFTLSDFNGNVKFKEAYFTFTIPKNTNVSGLED